MTLLTIVAAIGFLMCWYFLRQIVFYLVRCAHELAEIDASLAIITGKIESLYSPLESIEGHLDPNKLHVEPEP